mmetsp:Transcript_3962/g.4043  ORF Transcript_3962/g.4043 Transcript_3962/m.4043 type:complete len:299 (-) Transcript_3962:264-1160(-)
MRFFIMIAIFSINCYESTGFTAFNSYRLSMPSKLVKEHGYSSDTRHFSWTPMNVVPHIRKTPDILAFVSYFAATGIQWSFIMGFLNLMQDAVLKLNIPQTLPVTESTAKSVIMATIFLFCSLRTRIFSPLDNSRPKADKNDPVFKDRLRPSWQPPPFIFPIVWSIISILRTISSVLIWQTTGTVICKPIFTMMAHLAMGDTWNTINNVERRAGTSFLFVLFTLMSIYATIYEYWETLPLAGYILAPSGVWITIATFLIFTIWRINRANLGYPSLFPSIEEGPPSSWKVPFFRWIRKTP